MSNPATIPNPPEQEEKSFLEKHRGLAIIAVLLLAVGLVVLVQKKLSGGGGTARKSSEFVSVRLPPPPPTPPPPQSTPPPQQEMKREEKMIDQAPVNENEEKPKDEPAPAPDISTGIKGDGGNDGFGVGGRSGNGQIGGTGSGRSGSKWGWYAAQVSGSIKDALGRNAKTRVAKLNIKVRVWPDATGRIARVKAESTNDAALDRAISDALTGLQLKEAMPQGMPAPIVLKISAQR